MNAYWLSSMIGADAAESAVWLILGFVTLSAVVAALMLFLRRRKSVFRKAVRRGNHRISVRDVIAVDSRRRLVIVRRDNMEHLLLTGGDSDVVIETFVGLAEDKEAAAEASAAKNAELRPVISDVSENQKIRGNENAYMAKTQPIPQNTESATARLPTAGTYSGHTDNGTNAAVYQADAARAGFGNRPQNPTPWNEEQERLRKQQQMHPAQDNRPYANADNGNPFPPYTAKQGRPAANAAAGFRDGSAAASTASSYAPYLGYIPHSGNSGGAVPQSGHNVSAQAERAAAINARQDNNNSGSAPSAVRNFDTAQARRNLHNGNDQNSERRSSAGESAASAPTPLRRPSFRNLRENNAPGNNSNLSSRNNLGNTNGFSGVNLPENNDFDKILQDELLRAPNGIKFSSSQKKVTDS